MYNKVKAVLEDFRILRKSKEDKILHFQIENSINKLEDNLMVEMEKIKGSLTVVDEIKELLEEYKSNQIITKNKMVELYKEFEELKLFKDTYIKDSKL